MSVSVFCVTRCLSEIPKDIGSRRSLSHYSDTLEMYISICTVLKNCITHSNQYTAVAFFSADSLFVLFSLLNIDLYRTYCASCSFTTNAYDLKITDERFKISTLIFINLESAEPPRLIYLCNRLWTEIYNFIAVLSLTEDQHFEAIQSALELCGAEMVMASICFAIKDSTMDLKMSATSCLAFLLSQEIQKESLGKSNMSLQTVIDTSVEYVMEDENKTDNLRNVISSVNKLSIRDANVYSKKHLNQNEKDLRTINDKISSQKKNTIGNELCGLLLHLFIAHNYAKSKKNYKQSEDRDIIIGALTNLLCVSKEAKRTALQGNLPETALMILKELYVKLNFQPFELYKKQAEKKVGNAIFLMQISCYFCKKSCIPFCWHRLILCYTI